MNPLKALYLQQRPEDEADMSSTLSTDPQERKRKARCEIFVLASAHSTVALRYSLLPDHCSGSLSWCSCFSSLILPAVMTRVLTKWLSVFWWDSRRSWKVLRREQCSVWGDRWTSSFSRPWTRRTCADSFMDGNPGCDLEGSSMVLQETSFYAGGVLTFHVGISQLKLVPGARRFVCMWWMFGVFFSITCYWENISYLLMITTEYKTPTSA